MAPKVLSWTSEYYSGKKTMRCKNEDTPMAKETTVRAKMEPDLKRKVESVFSQLGLTTTAAITLFYRQVELNKGLPFEVKLPNRVTVKTFQETDAGKNLKEFQNSEELFRDLGI